MSFSFSTKAYENTHHFVSRLGLKCYDNKHFDGFLITKNAKRLDDTEGNDEFLNHLNGLSLTGLGKENPATVIPEYRRS